MAPGRKKGGPKTGGRPKGGLNKATVEGRAFCQALLDRPKFKEWLLENWDAGTVEPRLVIEVMHYAWGKPKQEIDVDAKGSLLELLTGGNGS